jgi:hypothetical protein
LAQELGKRGHVIEFVVDTTADSIELIREAGFPIRRVDTLSTRIFRGGFRRLLRDLVRDGRYDAVHWFEKNHGVYEAARAAAESGCAFVWTVTSGGPPTMYHGVNRVVVFTSEVAEHARRTSPRTAVHIVPARINLGQLSREFARDARTDVRKRLGLEEGSLLVVRVARCAAIYVRSIQLGIELTERLNFDGRDGKAATFLHVGYIQDPDAAARIQQLVEAANERAGRTIARTETHDVALGARYVAAADFCIASGRGALEALVLGRPTLVAFGPRYLGMVDETSIRDLAERNFQGRNDARTASADDDLNAIQEAVRRRLEDPARSARTQEACARFISDHYSIEGAATFYEGLYDDRTVGVASSVQHYTHPRHLLARLRRLVPRRYRDSRPKASLRRSIK